MQDIVACSVEHTRKSGGKRVAPYHLYVPSLTTGSVQRRRMKRLTF